MRYQARVNVSHENTEIGELKIDSSFEGKHSSTLSAYNSVVRLIGREVKDLENQLGLSLKITSLNINHISQDKEKESCH